MASAGMEWDAPREVVVYNESGSDISRGYHVIISGTATIENPVPSLDLTKVVPAVALGGAYKENFEGVAMETIPDGGRGKICIGGICDCAFAASQNIAVGDQIDVAASGLFTEEAGSDQSYIVAIALEANASTSAGDLIKCWINERRTAAGDKTT